MNRSHLWKFLFVVFVLVWSITEMLPPTARNLIDQFDQSAVSPDATFNAIVTKARQSESNNPTGFVPLTYSNLVNAIGTTDIRKYFPSNFLDKAEGRAPQTVILNRLQREAAGKFKLGLDLSGGTAWVLEMDLSKVRGTNAPGSTNAPATSLADNIGQRFLVEQAITVLRRRVDAFGVAEPLIQPAGENRIEVQLPGLSEADKESARISIQKAAFLEFRMVDPDMADHAQGPSPESWLVPPGYEIKYEKIKGENGQVFRSPVIVKDSPELGLTGDAVSSARVSHDPMTGRPEVHFTLNGDGATKFAQITRANVGQRLAIVLDGEVVSAPNINSPIPSGQGSITGNFSDAEAFELATSLENPLKTPLRVVEERGVDPSLGADSVKSGIKASIGGIVLVAGFMLVYYLLAGAVANVALICNVIILLGVMCSLNVTYTLPGIAGIVLTVGMAVDANVLIFERIREEQARGKSVRGALAAGYSRAFGTIFDSHVTTLISSVILIVMGTGTVKGFGVALTIGVAASLFTALVITRLIFDFLLVKTSVLKDGVKMLHLIRKPNLDFMALSKPAFAFSWLIIVVGLGYGIFVRGSNMAGIEFAGGENITLTFAQKVDREKIRTVVDQLKLGEGRVGYQIDQSTQRETLRVEVPHNEEGAKGGKSNLTKVEEALKQAFPEAKYVRLGTESFGPAVGQEIQKAAIIASLLSLFGILIYVAFRYEFSFAIGAVVAILHDVLMTLGMYCLTGLWSEGRQFNATFVAALLTIIGFSINDTIVIFDRIREDLKLGVPGSFRDLINRATNETLSRTIITSGTVFLATLSLYLFGGGPINDFAFTFLVGVITGTYSSIYIASALVLWWHKGQRPVLNASVVPVEVEPSGAKA
jgi:SecD/SecF fusion protein